MFHYVQHLVSCGLLVVGSELGLYIATCRFGGLVQKVLASTSENGKNSPINTIEESDELTKEQFRALLEKIDSGLRALPATAQVCFYGSTHG